MSIKLEKINKERVKPIPLPQIDEKKIKGFNLFGKNLYPNVFLLAKKNSGKTSTIFKILKSCANKRSTVLIFSSTVFKDPNYQAITEWLDDKGIPHFEYTGIIEDGENHVKALTEQLQKCEEEPDEPDKPPVRFIHFDESDEEEEKKPRKPKKLAPEYILVFDDIANQLRDPSIDFLLKRNRHLHVMNIISSQYLHDLNVGSILNLDFMLIWPNVPEQKLKIAYERLDLSISYPLFLKLYKTATSEKYNFLYIDVRNDTFRKNFNKKFVIENPV